MPSGFGDRRGILLVVRNRPTLQQTFFVCLFARFVSSPLHALQRFAEMTRNTPPSSFDVPFSSPSRPLVVMIEPLDRADLCTAMLQCTAIVNSSESEGMCGAVLEAMHNGCSVCVRGNSGNRAIVEHEVDGLVFEDPAQFVTEAKRLLTDPKLAARLQAAAQHRIQREHSAAHEQKGYQAVVAKLAGTT
eukprot:m.245611 g.245611  ORF g.245611 m.245611 type:complete len:189 (+) comp19053_c0_seq3:941-1507(+)